MPSSIGSSGGPTPRIWKKWSMTQIESKPTSSAWRTIRARVGPMAGRAAGPGEGVDLQAELHVVGERTGFGVPMVASEGARAP